MFSISAPDARITYKRRLDRTVDELIGLCRGLIADGEVNHSEIQFLETWLRANREFRQEYPFNVLFERVADALEDGVIDPDEERDLLAAIHGLSGEMASVQVPEVSTSTTLPLCNPAPAVAFSGAVFVVTGTCTYGSRAKVADAIAERGGRVASNVSRKVGFLVIGDVGSRDWMHSSYGRKIEAAVQLRDTGAPLAIVSERHWQAHL